MVPLHAEQPDRDGLATTLNLRVFFVGNHVNWVQTDVKYDFVYVDKDSFEKYKPTSFKQLIDCFQEYKGGK